MIKIGNSNIVGVSLGDTQFSKIYKGVDLYWRKKPLDISDFIIERGNEVVGDVVMWDNENQEKVIVNIGNVKKFPKSNYTPIGMVAIPSSQNVYGDGSGSMVSLKIMDCNNPDNGWGYNDSTCENPYWGSTYTTLGSTVTDSSKAKTTFNQDTVNSKIRNYNPYDWKTSLTINNVTTTNNYPAGFCCWRYHTEGTNQGDWYFPSSGEVSQTRISNVNDLYKQLYDLGYNVYLYNNNEANNKLDFYSTNTCTEIRYDQQWFCDLYSDTLSLMNHTTRLRTFAFCRI